MAEINILNEVKNRMGITGTFHDSLLHGYIADVKQYMKDAGVDDAIIEGVESAGVITQGVKDLWNMESGNGKFSPYFYQRVVQLKYKALSETKG